MPAATFGLLGAGVAVGFEDRDGNLSGIALTTAGTPERVDHVEHVGPVDDATETDVPVGVVTDSTTAAQPRRSPSRSSAARTPGCSELRPTAAPTSSRLAPGDSPVTAIGRSDTSLGCSGRARWYRSAAPSNDAASRSRSPLLSPTQPLSVRISRKPENGPPARKRRLDARALELPADSDDHVAAGSTEPHLALPRILLNGEAGR